MSHNFDFTNMNGKNNIQLSIFNLMIIGLQQKKDHLISNKFLVIHILSYCLQCTVKNWYYLFFPV